MTEPKFTPGPWEARYIVGDDVWEIGCGAGATTIAASHANAQLISAAPDLYTALRDVLALVGWRGPERDIPPALIAARAALSKAEGA